jgi:hypothetical protein
MGIDIYAHWKGQSADETEVQTRQWLSIASGSMGYLREAYHGEPYATQYLCAEAFETDDGAQIGATVLRERAIYQSEAKEIEAVKQSFRDFVALCERKEKETGEPVRIIASY